MSWIDEAKRDAQAELQREKNDRECKEAADKLAADLEHARKMDIFHRHTNQVRQEIEKVLAEARQQGLSVSEAVEGYYAEGNYDQRCHPGNSREDDPHYDSYAIKWIVTEQSVDETYDIYLGLEVSEKKESKKKRLVNELITSYTPTNSAQNVELCIKNWLTEIYLEEIDDNQ